MHLPLCEIKSAAGNEIVSNAIIRIQRHPPVRRLAACLEEDSMIACRLSDLELRSIIESAFLPLRCNCTVSAAETMTVEVVDPATERVELYVSGIVLDRLDTSRAICDLITHLRSELERNSHPHALAS